MFMIPFTAYWKLQSPSFWIPKRCTLSRRDNAYLTWAGSILLFVNVQEISFSSKSQHKICDKRKRINRGAAYGLEILDEYLFNGNEKAIRWAKRTIGGVDGNVKKKFKIFKTKPFWKKNQLSIILRFVFSSLSAIGRYFSQR